MSTPNDNLTGQCEHCGRSIVKDNGIWIDPEATGDDSIWRETCDGHDTFTAEHIPKATQPQPQQRQTFRDSHVRALEKQVIEYALERDTLQAQRDSAQIAFSKLAQAHDEVLTQRDELMAACKQGLAFIDDGEGGHKEAKAMRAAIARATGGGSK